MNIDYLERARKVIPNARLLVVAASRRATELAQPSVQPLVPVLPDDKRTYLDIALLEIAEGKITIDEVK